MFREQCSQEILIDKYITPFLLSSDTPNFTPLAHAIGKVACFYGVGIVATYTYNRIMINVTQGNDDET